MPNAQHVSGLLYLKRILGVLSSLLLAFALALSTASLAFADYVNPKIITTAQVQTDGSLRVVEQRSFHFEEPYGAIWWQISGLSDKSSVVLNSIRYASIDAEGAIASDWATLPIVPFQTSWRGALADTEGIASKMHKLVSDNSKKPEDSQEVQFPESSAASLDERRATFYAFVSDMPLDIVFECDYTISNALRVFDDVAELYWDYVPARDDVEMENVKATVVLPLPEGIEAVPQENVYAWGHGPAGSIEVFANGSIVFDVEEVAPGQYAQAHVVFPQAWVENLSAEMKAALSGTRLDQAIKEEGSWTDTWSNARMNALYVNVVVSIICMLALLFAAVMYAVYGREHIPRIKDGASGLSGYSPALVGRLLRSNHESTDDLVASLIKLGQDGVLQIESVDKDISDLGVGYGDLRFRVTPSAKEKVSTKEGQATLRLIFDVCAEGYLSTSFEEVLNFAKKHPDRFKDAMIAWQNELTDGVSEAGVFDSKSVKAQKAVFVLSLALLAIAFGSFFLGGNIFAGITFALTAVIVAVVANYTKRYTQLGCDIDAAAARYAKTLEDSTCLQPGDVGSYAAYAFVIGDAERAVSKITDPDDIERLWFAKRRGRGGRIVECLAKRLSYVLAKAFSNSCK